MQISGSGQLSTDVDELLWQHYMSERMIGPTQFGWNLMGIGALFFAFAYASVTPASGTGLQFLREIIALVGMAASSIQFMHSWASKVNTDWLAWEINSTSPTLMGRYWNAGKWRTKGGWPNTYLVSVRSLIIDFHGLLALVWLVLFVDSVTPVPVDALWLVLGTAALAAAVVTLHQGHKVKTTKPGPPKGWEPWSPN